MDTVNRLLEHDLMLGTLAKESRECFERGFNTASLACIFIFVEQGLKMSLHCTEGNFNQLLHLAAEKQLLSPEEFATLDEVRRIRNSIFHESHYKLGYLKEGIAYILSEDESKAEIFHDLSGACFEIILKIGFGGCQKQL
jgi:hypothetical protein